jgi:hypothetical protein
MKIYIICLLVLAINTIKINQVSDADPKNFNILTSPNTIKEVFSAIKLSKVDGGAGVKECYDLIFKSKYESALKQFWTNLGKVCSKENEIIPRDLFNTLLNSSDEAIKIEGIEKKCNDVIVGNMISGDEVTNPIKQRELRRIMEPFFAPPSKPVGNYKNIITAFIGVHRNTDQYDTLINKLNRS